MSFDLKNYQLFSSIYFCGVQIGLFLSVFKKLIISLIYQKFYKVENAKINVKTDTKLKMLIMEHTDLYDWAEKHPIFEENYNYEIINFITHHQINGKKPVELLETLPPNLQLAISKFSDPYDWAKNQPGFDRVWSRSIRVHQNLIRSLIRQKFNKLENPKINVKIDTGLQLLIMQHTDLYDWAEKHPLFEGNYNMFTNRLRTI